MRMPEVGWHWILFWCALLSFSISLIQLYFDSEPMSATITLIIAFPINSALIFVVVWPIYLVSKMILNEKGHAEGSNASKD